MILRRNAADRFSTVEREWEGKTVVLIGGGPSLTQEQVALAHEAHKAGRIKCIAINDAYLWAPWADVSYFADSSWWKEHTNGVAKPLIKLSAQQVRERFSAFAGQKCSIQNSGANVADEAVHILRNKDHPHHGVGLSYIAGSLVTGRNGGFQALNLSILAGGKVDILLGYDGAPDKKGRSHWSGGHSRPTPQDAYEHYRAAFTAAEGAIKKLGVRVINCSPGSEINSFEKMTLEEALALDHASV